MKLGCDYLKGRANKVYLIDPNMSFKDKVKYVNYFVTRAFLITVFLLFISTVLFVSIYFGDLLLNVKSGKYKNPLYSAYIIVSKSMVPTINVQDGVFVKRKDNLQIGDIITYSAVDPNYAGSNITHRIVGRETLSNGKEVYRTRGDNNNHSDRFLVPFDKIYGKVLVKLPFLGYLRNFITNPIGLILSLLLTISLIYMINFSTKKIRSY